MNNTLYEFAIACLEFRTEIYIFLFFLSLLFFSLEEAMNKQEIIEHLNEYVDQIVEEHKFKLFSRYVKSKKVQFVACSVAPNLEYTFMTGKTITGGHTVKIFDRLGKREPQRMQCSCADWTYRLKKSQQPCKHIFALIERYQTKRTQLTTNLKGE